jgi:hypothetical protein
MVPVWATQGNSDSGGQVDEIFSDGDVLQVFELHDDGVVPKLDSLDPLDRALIATFFDADQNPGKLASPDALTEACTVGVKVFEGLSDDCPAGWRKFVLYITSLNTQTLWDRFQKHGKQSQETAIFADWVVFTIGRNGWGPDGNETPLGRQHSYCMAVAAESGGGIKQNPQTGRFEAPDGSVARNYDASAALSVQKIAAPAAQPPAVSAPAKRGIFRRR